MLYVDGWGFRVYNLTEKYQDLFIKKYTLKENFYWHNDLGQEQLQTNRQTTAIVGVHLRRGDYRTWKGGQYFFDNHVYMRYMSDLETKIAQLYQKNCFFLIFSNESISRHDFQHDANLRVSENPWYVDHVLMSQCDFLIGPPSVASNKLCNIS